MSEEKVGRRQFITGVGVGAASATVHAFARPAAAAEPQPVPAAPAPATPAPGAPAGYTFLRPDEASFVEALVDHMVPADDLTPSGTDIGIATFIDRALAGSWGKGDRLYMQGPWKTGTPNQGYQLPLTPAELYRAGIAASNAYCRKAYGKSFDAIAPAQREAFLKELSTGKAALEGVPPRAFFDVVYQTVMEGMFGDPIYGGNKDKVGWKLVGFPGVLANNAENIKRYNNNQRFPANPLGIADMS